MEYNEIVGAVLERFVRKFIVSQINNGNVRVSQSSVGHINFIPLALTASMTKRLSNSSTNTYHIWASTILLGHVAENGSSFFVRTNYSIKSGVI